MTTKSIQTGKCLKIIVFKFKLFITYDICIYMYLKNWLKGCSGL